MPEDAPSPDSTFEDVMPATESPPPDGFDSVDFQGIRVDVPTDWAVDEGDEALCVGPPDQEECRFGAFLVLPQAAERNDEDWPAEHFDDDDGWAAEPEECRSYGTATEPEDDAVPVDEADLATEDFGEHPAPDHDDDVRRSNYRAWSVTCDNDDTFEVRLWYLPQSDVAAYVWSVDEQYSSIYTTMAESMNIDDYLD